MIRYIVIKGIGSGDIVYDGDDRSDALGFFISPGEMYEIDLEPVTHDLSIMRSTSIGIGAGKNMIDVDKMRINRNVLEAILEGSDAQTEIPSSG